jgi:methyltransferase (TIGR00027 family)
VLDDPIAVSIVGAEGATSIRKGGPKFDSGLGRRLRSVFVARSRFAEDELSEAIKRGVRQYVILGAGLDTFAYRNPYSSSQLQVFEVDHPNTQAWKQKQLEAAKIPIPNSVTFVAVDFETQTLAEQLKLAGFNADEPTFFSWLGVSMYLTPEIVMATLKQVAPSTTGGGGIVFDYLTPFSQESFSRRLQLQIASFVSNLLAPGEPWLAFFDANVLAQALKAIGFTHVVDMGADDINTRYFHNRMDKLGVRSPVHLVSARV